MENNVRSLFGGATGQREPNENAISTLEELLEMARAGEIIGIAVAGLCHDGCGMYRLAGRVGGYSMLGAVEIAKAELIDIVRSD